ncbi:MAG: DUF4833 domain-containing protein, partial [Hymenobacter sp.]
AAALLVLGLLASSLHTDAAAAPQGTALTFPVPSGVANQQSVLDRIYLHIEGGTFWVPNVKYVELKGTLPTTREAVVSRFTV